MKSFGLRWGWLILLALSFSILPPLFWVAGTGWQADPPAPINLEPGTELTLVLAVYGFKPLYMLLSAGILLLIWAENSPAWLALRGSLAAFWLGELFCWINILFFREEVLVFEYLHSLLMVVCLGGLFFSAMEAADKDLLHFSDPQKRCALAGVCKECTKANPGSPRACLLLRLFKWMIPLTAVLAFMPLVAQPINYSIDTQVFGQARILTHLMPVQWYELRFTPIISIIMLAAAWLALSWRTGQPGRSLDRLYISKILLSIAMGHLGFSLMRLAFASFYQQELVWFVFWEELTELVLIIGVGVIVWLIRPVGVAQQFMKMKDWFAQGG